MTTKRHCLSKDRSWRESGGHRRGGDDDDDVEEATTMMTSRARAWAEADPHSFPTPVQK